MPNPTQSDLHINVPLTNVSVAYIQKSDRYIADKVFPRVPVKNQSDMYYRYSKSDWRRTDVQRRAPGTESVGINWNVDTDSYFAHVYAVHKDIDDQVRANADSVFKLDSDATAFVTNQLLLKRDIDWSAAFFRKGVWHQDIDLATTGSDATRLRFDLATSDPIGLFADLKIEALKYTGFEYNTMVMGANVKKALLNHPAIIDRIKYTQKGIVSEDLIKQLFEVDKIHTSYATVSEGPSIPDARLQDEAGQNKFVCDPNGVLLCHTTSAPALQTPTAGYIFTWNGYLAGNAQGIRMSRFRMEHIRSDRIEGEMTYDMKVVAPDMGIFLSNVVGPDAEPVDPDPVDPEGT